MSSNQEILGNDHSPKDFKDYCKHHDIYKVEEVQERKEEDSNAEVKGVKLPKPTKVAFRNKFAGKGKSHSQILTNTVESTNFKSSKGNMDSQGVISDLRTGNSKQNQVCFYKYTF
jgi:hypothetical protein